MKKIIALSLFIIATQLTGCATTTQNSVSGVQRSQLMLLPESQVISMSNASYLKAIKEAAKKQTLNVDPIQLERVRKISNQLIAQVGVFRTDAVQWKWEVNTEKSDQINAYCMPGGKIMVFTGLIEKLNATDDELGAVIGHEIAHALREHGRERMSSALIQQMGLAGLAAYLGTAKDRESAKNRMQIAALGTTLFFALPNGREQEREADRMGLELSARAGFNPDAAISLWQKMSAQNEAKPPEFLSTHPSDKNRIADLTALAPKMKPLYEETKIKK